MMKIGSGIGSLIAGLMAIAIVASALYSIWFLQKHLEEIKDTSDNAKKAAVSMKIWFWLLIASVAVQVLAGIAVGAVMIKSALKK